PGGVAGAVETGWLKICEILVPASSTTVLNANIYNIDAIAVGESNTSWTNGITSIYRNGSISDMKTGQELNTTHRSSDGKNHSDVVLNTTNIKNVVPDALGLNGRDLEAVLGASSASDAFTKLRAISSTGDFTGLRLGDYIDIPSLNSGAISLTWNASYQNLRAQIVSFDHYYNTGDTAVTSHHVVMQFKNIPIEHQYNATDTNAGGYAASALYTWLHGDLQTAIISALGLTPLTVHRLLSDHVTWEWKAESVFLPTEVEVFGTQAWGRGGHYTGSSLQFPLFASNPKTKVKLFNNIRSHWWEATDRSDSTANFCLAYSTGYAINYIASNTYGVVPAFLI
ncbi:hypothetical protein, partial [Oceanispirochaeta sp.]|uniref:hypothetical protein n=1 Tax=Oceanispirochaeta sp. TaxID=2035350 RepID=UPI00262C48E0